MSVSFARPNISEMVFRLYGRSIHPELLRMYAETRASQPAYCAVIRICDAGHWVEMRLEDQTVTEITSARRQPLPQQKRLLERRLCGQHDESITFPSGLHYQVSYQLEQLDPEVFLNFNEELLADCSKAEISHRFPAASRIAPGPLSLVRIDAETDSLLIHSYHTFPESNAVIKTQSLFEL
ncbi:MAG: DUF2617 family protein [Planctomycetaceae bacterium]